MTVAGFDAGKRSLSMFHEGSLREIPNRVRDIVRALRALPEGTAVAVEATGRLHLRLARAAHRMGMAVYVVNPKDAGSFREFLGRRSKTDRGDARELAEYASLHRGRLLPWSPPEARLALARDLLTARAALVRARAALEQSLSELPPAARRVVGDPLAGLRERAAAIDEELARLLGDDPRYRRMLTIPGVGPLCAAALRCALGGRGFRSADAFVAFLGLDLRVRESGERRGRRALTKRGCPLYRWLLFMAGRSATRTAAWGARYRRELDKGLAPTAAQVALARKIARTAWSMDRHGTDFDRDRLGRALT